MKAQIHSAAAPAHLLARRACLWAALGLLAALAFAPPPARAAVTEAWVQRYSNVVSNSNDQAVKVVRDAAGDVIVTGDTYDGINRGVMLTIKYSSADGSVLWGKRCSNANAQALAVDGSGNVVVTGTTGSEYYMAKYGAADGSLLWEQRYNDPLSFYYGSGYQAVAVDSGIL